MLDGFVPVRVLVPDRGEDLVQVERERVPNERPQNLVPLLLLQPVLDVRGTKVVVALHGGHAQHQLGGDETFTTVLHRKVRIRWRVRVGRPGWHESERVEEEEVKLTFTALLSSSGGDRIIWGRDGEEKEKLEKILGRPEFRPYFLRLWVNKL